MNRFDAAACAFISRNRSAHRLPEGGLSISVSQPDDIVLTAFYSPSEHQVAQSVTRAKNGCTVDQPVFRTIPVEGGIEAAKRLAEDLAISDMRAILDRAH